MSQNYQTFHEKFFWIFLFFMQSNWREKCWWGMMDDRRVIWTSEVTVQL